MVAIVLLAPLLSGCQACGSGFYVEATDRPAAFVVLEADLEGHLEVKAVLDEAWERGQAMGGSSTDCNKGANLQAEFEALTGRPPGETFSYRGRNFTSHSLIQN